MPYTGTGDIPAGVQEFYDKLHLAIAMPKLLHSLWAQKRPLKQGFGTQIKFRRYAKLAKAKTPIAEGVTPIGKKLSATDLLANVDQYGDWVGITDRVMLTQPDPQIKDAVKMLSIQESETMDELMRDVLLAGTSVYYANAVAAKTSIVTGVTTTDLDNIERSLDRENAIRLTEMVNASTGVGTAPLDECYIIITHTDCKKDYRALNGFIKVEEYPSTKNLLPGEVGSYGAFRVIATSEARIEAGGGGNGTTTYKNDGTSYDVYSDIILAQECYGDVPLDGASSGIIIKSHKEKDTSDTSDPLNQRSTVAWKNMWTARILNDSWMYRYEHASKL